MNFLVANKLLENIIGIKITVNHSLRVNVVKRDADHSKNSSNILFRDNFIFVTFDDITKTLVAFFHNDARMVAFVFNEI